MLADPQRLLIRLPAAFAARPGAAPATTEDGDGALPIALRRWLVRLRLLEMVPFAYLVPDARLLPPESVRWFFVDRRWTDALVQGALAVGTANSDDRTQLTARYPRCGRSSTRRSATCGGAAAPPAGSATTDYTVAPAGPISGFLLRSQAVSGWPALHVRAFGADPVGDDGDPVPDDAPQRIGLLRLERLAPAVLLCLFDGVPQVVHVEEPWSGIQFGVNLAATGPQVTASVPPRAAAGNQPIPGPAVGVPFRAGPSGVVDVAALTQRLSTAVGSTLDSADLAAQLIRLPVRQVFGPGGA